MYKKNGKTLSRKSNYYRKDNVKEKDRKGRRNRERGERWGEGRGEREYRGVIERGRESGGERDKEEGRERVYLEKEVNKKLELNFIYHNIHSMPLSSHSSLLLFLFRECTLPSPLYFILPQQLSSLVHPLQQDMENWKSLRIRGVIIKEET